MQVPAPFLGVWLVGGGTLGWGRGELFALDVAEGGHHAGVGGLGGVEAGGADVGLDGGGGVEGGGSGRGGAGDLVGIGGVGGGDKAELEAGEAAVAL